MNCIFSYKLASLGRNFIRKSLNNFNLRCLFRQSKWACHGSVFLLWYNMWRHYVCSGQRHTHFPAAWAGDIGNAGSIFSLMSMLPPSIMLTDYEVSRTFFKIPIAILGFIKLSVIMKLTHKNDTKHHKNGV